MLTRGGFVLPVVSLEQVHEWYQARNSKDWNRVADFLAKRFVFHNMGETQSVHGADGYLEHVKHMLEAFPDLRLQIERISGTGRDGEPVIVEYTGWGHQAGAWGAFPPSNRSASLRFCDLLRFENGKLTSCRTYFDSYGPLAELGHVVSKSPLPKAKNAGEAA